MALIEITMIELIKQKIENNTSSSDSTVQFKIPTDVFPLSVIYHVLESIQDSYALDSKKTIIIKIAQQAIQYWESVDDNAKTFVRKINDNFPKWVDTKGNLTYYRNDLASKQEDNTQQVLILIGGDKVNDQASLEHIPSIGIQEIWLQGMNSSFISWLQKVAEESSYSESIQDDITLLNDCDALLKTVLLYSDQLSIAGYLESLPIEKDINDGFSLFDSIAFHLDRLQLGACLTIDRRKTRWRLEVQNVLAQTYAFFSGHITLENAKFARSQKSIQDISTSLLSDDIDSKKLSFLNYQEKVYPTFDSPEAYIEACMAVLTRSADDETIQRLRQCDSLSLINKVLKYKTSKKKTKTSDTEVFGNALEMILSALWDSLALFTRSEFRGFKEIISIKIEPVNFFHNVPASDINDNTTVGEQYEYIFEEKLLTLIGGIDDVLSESIFSELKSSFDDEFIFTSNLDKKNSYLGKTTSKPASIPALQFVITINDDLSTKYIWKIIDTHAYTISGNLVRVINEQISLHKQNAFLPTFKIQDYQEVFSMLSEEDMRESFRSAIGRSKEMLVENLLDNLPKEGLNSVDYVRFASLGNIAAQFYNIYANKGLYAALSSGTRSEFVKTYSNLLNSIVDTENEYDDLFYPLLTYAFWIIDEQLLKNDSWKFEGYMSSGIISLLHPAMIEMLDSQKLFLTGSFLEQFKNAESLLRNKCRMTLRMWSRSLELATLQSPIPCLLINRNNISTRVRGEDVIYRIGVLSGSLDDTVLLTRFRMTNEDDYDTISDSALTKVGEESTLLKRLIRDYFHVYALAQDGINIAIFKNFNIQPVIAALITLVKEIVPETNSNNDKWYDEHPFRLSITFYSDTSDDSGISSWINRWQEFWEIKAQTDMRYSRCKLLVSHRMLEINGDGQNSTSFETMIDNELDADVSVLYEMPLGDSGNTNLIKIPKLPDDVVTVKFPLLEKLAQRRIGFTTNFKRSRILSNRQFRVYRAFLRYLYAMKLREFGSFSDSEIIINEERDFSKWKKTLDWCHKKSERVICIGGEIDKDLITDSETEGPVPIVVGFGSGVGAHAELNYTVSCQVDKNETLLNQLVASFRNIYSFISQSNAEIIVKNLYQQSKRMADLSLVRTIGTTDYYKHDYFGYTLARRMLKVSDDSYDCDVVLSLDSYRHWFHEELIGKRADLLWLRAKQITSKAGLKYALELTIIEVKMGFNVENAHLDKAIMQVQATIPVLKKHFTNSLNNSSPDSRYWWMQLYRIIATNPRKHVITQKNSLECLESLAEGVFDISWDASIFCFDGNDLADGKKVALRHCSFDETSNDCSEIDGCDAYIFAPSYVEEFGLVSDDDISDWDEQKVKLSDSFAKKNHEYSLHEARAQEKEEQDDEVEGDYEDEQQSIEEQFDDNGEIDKPETSVSAKDGLLEPTTDASTPWGAESPGMEVADPGSKLVLDNQTISSDLRVLIGTTKQGKEVHWNFGTQSQIVNRHMFILGGSGSGKTYAIQGMLAELAKAKQASLIIDYTNGFTMNQVENEVKNYMRKQWYVANKKLSFNPFLAYTLQIDPEDPDSLYTDQPINVAQRIVDVFIRVYGSIGENQISILTDTIEEGLKIYKGKYSLTQLHNDLQSRIDDPSVKSSIIGLVNKLNVLLKMDPFSTEASDTGWKEIYGSEGKEQITVFQLAQIAPYVQKIIIEFSLWDLWNHVIAMKATQNNPRVVVLDEIQNLSLSESSPVRKYLQEGRKLGLSLMAATQSFAGMKGISSPEMNSLMNAGTKLFFRPTDQEIPSVAKLIYNFDSSRTEADWRNELGKLAKGQCIVVINNGTDRRQSAMIVKVPSMKERGI